MKELKESLASKLVEFESARNRLQTEQTELKAAKRKLAYSQEARVLIQSAAKEVQQLAHCRISEVVSKCLDAVFDDPYEFEIEFVEKRGRTEAEISFVRGGNRVDPITAAGGGVVDVAAFALRLAAISLRRPPVRKLLVLDEPFRFVSSEYRPRIRGLLESLSKELEVQIILVTHLDSLRIGKVIEIRGG